MSPASSPRELAELAALRAALRGPAAASRTDIEEKIRNICDAALEGRKLDLHDNLFEVGASSLKLIEIHEQIDREFPGQLDLTELFDFPTIAELAAHLEGEAGGTGLTSSGGIAAMYVVFALLALGCGVVLTTQVGSNSLLGKSLHDSVHSGRGEHGRWPRADRDAAADRAPAAARPAAVARAAPWWTWIAGGLLGTTYLTANVLLAPKLGAAALVGFVVTGQLLFAVLADQFGWLGFEQHSASVWRCVGCVLMMAGVALIARF